MTGALVLSSLAIANRRESAMGTGHDKFMAMLEALDAGEPLEPKPAPAGVPSEPMDEQLEDLTGLAITRIRQVLEVEPDFRDEKQTRLQATAAQGVLNIQAKVDEGRLKRAKLNTLPKLIELIAEERARRAAEDRAREMAETERERQVAGAAPVIEASAQEREPEAREQNPLLQLVRKK
jgi:hypothetical protein